MSWLGWEGLAGIVVFIIGILWPDGDENGDEKDLPFDDANPCP